jgi:hypothetical protein
MIPAELDTGPPKMRRPGGRPGQRKVSMEWTTDDIYSRPAQPSSASLRPACSAPQAQQTAKWTCSHASSLREA